jgi:hypothetical protein
MRTSVTRRTITPAVDVDHFADVRELETLRSILRREMRTHGGQRGLARQIGIDRGSLRKFASGQSTPERRTVQAIREWAADRPPVSVPFAAVALALLVDDLGPAARPAARRHLAAVLGRYHEAGGGVPTWVGDEIGRADMSELAAGAPTATPVAVALLARIRELVEDYEPEGDEAALEQR